MAASRELHCQLNRIEPCLPRFAKKPPAGPGWIHEIKHDGFRIIAVRDGARVRLLTRKASTLPDASLRSPRRLRCCRCALASSTARRSRATRMAWPYSTYCATGGEIALLRFAHSIFLNWKVTTHAGRLLKSARARWRSCWVGHRTASLSASTTAARGRSSTSTPAHSAARASAAPAVTRGGPRKLGQVTQRRSRRPGRSMTWTRQGCAYFSIGPGVDRFLIARHTDAMGT
jgi:hypothetical protein